MRYIITIKFLDRPSSTIVIDDLNDACEIVWALKRCGYHAWLVDHNG